MAKKGLNPKPNTFLYDPIKISNPVLSAARTKREKRKQFVPEQTIGKNYVPLKYNINVLLNNKV